MKKLSRAVSLVLAGSLLTAVTACTNETQPSTTPTGTPAPTAEAGIYTPGTYTGSAQGFGGLVSAEITVDANAITAVTLTGADETPDIGGKALEKLTASVQEKGAEFDSISGATYTSDAVRSAVTDALAQAKGEATAAGTVADGKYTVEVIGHEGTIVVTTMFVDGKITSVTVPSNNETVGVGTYAVERIPGRIVEAQSVNVDEVSGATITSTAIKQGVSEAIKLAGGNLADFSAAPEAPEVVPEEVTEDVDVVIMGAGTAGLLAAARLMEAGVENVILFEKTDIPGGSMAMAFGGFVGTDSQTWANWGLGREATTMCGPWEVAESMLLKIVKPDENGNARTELPWLKQMYQNSGKLYDWMVNIGVGFYTLGVKDAYTSPYFSPGCYEGGAGYAMQFFVDRITHQGARIIYNTPVTDLIQDETGRIVGVKAQGEDGRSWTVTADAVMLASGSFAKNKEMLEQYHTEWADSYFSCPESLTGDGIQLALKYGGVMDYQQAYLPGFLASYDSHFELAFMHYTTPGIIVNVNGDQFGNIMKSNHAVMSAAKADPANGDTFYFIFDDDAAASTRNNAAYGFNTYEGIFEKGEAVHYDSVAEASAALSLPNLQATIDTNNALAIQGPEAADEWGRTKLPYIDTREGVWAIRVDPNVYLTTAGIRVDMQSHVLNADNEIIPGLYAAGDVIGAYEERDGQNYGNGFDAAVSFGAICGDVMAAEIQ